MFTAIGTPKQFTGTTEGTLLGSNKGSDYVGFKQYQDPELGYLGGGFSATQGITPNDPAVNTYRLYLGGEKLWEIAIGQQHDEIVLFRWYITVKDISSDTLTLAVDLHVARGEYSAVVPCADVNVDRSEADESMWLEPVDITCESNAVGRGAQVRQIVIT